MAVPNDIQPTILLVDDDADVRRIAGVILSERDFRVIEASSAEEAMEIIRGSTRIDLLMTDLAMPGVGGIELAHLAKRVRPGLKVLYTSAYVRASDSSKALHHGPFIEKPWRLEQLEAAIEKLLGPRPPRSPT